jgi:VWFA-related protein
MARMTRNGPVGKASRAPTRGLRLFDVTFLVSVALAASGSFDLHAQSASSPSRFLDAIDVRAVTLEVVITDARGNEVSGLGREDFRLLLDDEEVTIDYFAQMIDGQPQSQGEPAEGQALDRSDRVERNFLVFIDEYFGKPADRNLVLRTILDQLDDLSAGDRMAVVAYDGRRLVLLCSWDATREELRQALVAARRRPADRKRLDLRQKAPDAMIAALTEERELLAVVTASAAAMRSLPQPTGRRILLLLSGGWNFSAIGRASVTDPEDAYGELAAVANRLGYTIYPVDVPGTPPTATDQRFTLELLARRTGGEAVVGVDRTKALARAAEGTRAYYLLGFSPDWRQDDRVRHVRVEVDGKGFSARARSTLLDLSPEQSVAMLLEGLLLGATARQPNQVPVKLGKAQAEGRRGIRLALSLALPVDAVVFLPEGEELVAELELHLAVQDDEGMRSHEIEAILFSVRVKAPPAPGTYVSYDTALSLRDRGHRIAVAVRDRVGGAVLTGVADYRQ